MFTLTSVVPWGRSFDEYQCMFSLSENDFGGSILGCADGPASFNAEATRRGVRAVSCDPIYRFTTNEIRDRIDATYDAVLEQTRTNAHEFVWSTIGSVEELGEVRMAAMNAFLADYEAGKRAGRYVDAELPALPFIDDSFDLALCSHFLFLYSTQLGEAFHHSSLLELCRVAREVRVFPLLALGGERSPHLDSSVDALQAAGFRVTVESVAYEFQRGGNQMMCITA